MKSRKRVEITRMLASVVVLFPLFLSVGPPHVTSSSLRRRPATPEATKLIYPGRSIGSLNLGDSRERALQIFPKKENADTEYDIPNCGTEYDWVDLRTPHAAGNVFINFKDDRVSQISSTVPYFETATGIKTGSSPKDVKRQFKGSLESYMYRGRTPDALHQSPLIVWIDEQEGIAFSFVYSSEQNHEFSVYAITIFSPKSSFCAPLAGNFPDVQIWKKLEPYALTP